MAKISGPGRAISYPVPAGEPIEQVPTSINHSSLLCNDSSILSVALEDIQTLQEEDEIWVLGAGPQHDSHD